jgi:hypothetical protein
VAELNKLQKLCRKNIAKLSTPVSASSAKRIRWWGCEERNLLEKEQELQPKSPSIRAKGMACFFPG